MRVFLWFVLSACLSEIAPATVVTTLSDEDDGNLSPGGGSGVSLREAINHSPATTSITFDAALSGGTVLLDGSELAISKDLIIDASTLAEKITIDAGATEAQRNRAVSVALNVTVTLSSICVTGGIGEDGAPSGGAIDGGDGADGGGILNQGSLTLIDCLVTDNRAGAGGVLFFAVPANSAGAGGRGGGVCNLGSMSLVDTEISDNRAGVGGRGDIDDVYISSGSGGNGGGIYSDGTLAINSSTISRNRAGAGGGGMDFGSALTGGAGGHGGGVYCLGSLSIAGSDIQGNTSGAGGTLTFGGRGGSAGGIYCDSSSNPGIVSISNTRLLSNRASILGEAGGLLTIGPCELFGCEISGNSSGDGEADTSGLQTGPGGDGGGILNSSGQLDLVECLVSDNRTGAGSSDNIGTPGGNGGGIFNGGTLSVTRCTIRGNVTGRGGGGFSGSADGGAGAGIFNTGDLTLDASLVVANQTGLGAGAIDGGDSGGDGGHGGGIYSAGTSLVKNSTIVSNLCGNGGPGASGTLGGDGGSGGGIYSGGAITLNQTTIFENEAGEEGPASGSPGSDGLGGGVFLTDKLSLLNSIIAANQGGSAPDLDSTTSTASTTALQKNLLGILDGSTLANGLDGVSGGTLILPLDPQLDPLGDYGGPTMTLRPAAGSPAVDGGGSTTLVTDQRGATRVSNGIVDLGAVEHQGAIGELLLRFEDDDDGDGMGNGLEIAIGSNPSNSDQNHPNRPRLEFNEQGEPEISFGYSENAAALIVLRLTRSSDLVTFDTVLISNSDQPFDVALGNPIRVTDGSPPDIVFYRLEAILR